MNINHIKYESRHRELFDLLGAVQGQSLDIIVQLCSMQVTRFVEYQ